MRRPDPGVENAVNRPAETAAPSTIHAAKLRRGDQVYLPDERGSGELGIGFWFTVTDVVTHTDGHVSIVTAEGPTRRLSAFEAVHHNPPTRPGAA